MSSAVRFGLLTAEALLAGAQLSSLTRIPPKMAPTKKTMMKVARTTWRL